jgi:hypothetical protein
VLGHPFQASGGYSQTQRLLCSGGPKEFLSFVSASLSERLKTELFWGFLKKAEGAPVQGVGFSPEAVPSTDTEEE